MSYDRVTRKDAEKCAENLAKTLKKKLGKCWKQVDGKNVAEIGCWETDYNPTYGGININEIMSEGGGVDGPFGLRRLKPDTFCVATRYAEKAVEIERKRKEEEE